MSATLSADRLLGVELFQGIPEADVQELLSSCDDLAFNAGDVIFEAGQEERALYVLVEGVVEIDLEVPNLGERVLAELQPGSVFGEMSFFHPSPHAATARCVTAARVIRLLRSQFDTLAGQHALTMLRLTANAAEVLAARLQHTDEWIVEVLTRQREREVREHWKKLREGMMTNFGPPRPFMSVGMPG